MLPKRLHQTEDAWILGRDTVGDGRGDTDDFLEHFDEGVVFVFAGFDLTGFHAEGGFEVHSLHSVLRLAICTIVLTERVQLRKRSTCMVWWKYAA